MTKYGSGGAKVKGQDFVVKTKQLSDKYIAPCGSNIVSQVTQSDAQSQGVRSDSIENDKYCVTNNNVIVKWVNIDAN